MWKGYEIERLKNEKKGDTFRNNGGCGGIKLAVTILVRHIYKYSHVGNSQETDHWDINNQVWPSQWCPSNKRHIEISKYGKYKGEVLLLGAWILKL